MPVFLPALLRTAENPNTDVRAMILTSLGFRSHPKGGIIFEDLKTVQDFGPFGSWMRYGQSKLVNVLYARETARRYPSFSCGISCDFLCVSVLSMSVSHASMNFKKGRNSECISLILL